MAGAIKTSSGVTEARTRQRLLEAAGEVFAEQGYRCGTVRDICKRAGANVAAVNYHFGGKEGLYAEVLRYAVQIALEKYPVDMGLGAGARPAERLRAFVESFLCRILDPGRPAWHGKLTAREMIEPTEALDALVKTIIGPIFRHLCSIVCDLLGGRPTEAKVHRFAASVVAQCLFYQHARPVVQRLMPEQTFGPEQIKDLAEHITRFSLAAIQGKTKLEW